MTAPQPPRSLAVYLRVSTQPQELRSQTHAVREFCRRHGWKYPVPARIYAEKISGTKAKRTELDKLCQACRAGEVDTVLVYALHRVGRSLHHVVNLLAEWDRLKIRLVCANDGVDLSDDSANTRFIRNMLISTSQFEVDSIRERTKVGIAAARKAGRVGGRKAFKQDAAALAMAQMALTKSSKAKGGMPSLRETAKKFGISASYLSMLVSGKRKLK